MWRSEPSPSNKNGLPACLPGCLAVCIGVIETCLLHPVSLICLNVQWPIITAMSRRRKQPIISGLAGLVEPIRSRIPMVTCAWKPGHSQSEQRVPLSYGFNCLFPLSLIKVVTSLFRDCYTFSEQHSASAWKQPNGIWKSVTQGHMHSDVCVSCSVHSLYRPTTVLKSLVNRMSFTLQILLCLSGQSWLLHPFVHRPYH